MMQHLGGRPEEQMLQREIEDSLDYKMGEEEPTLQVPLLEDKCVK